MSTVALVGGFLDFPQYSTCFWKRLTKQLEARSFRVLVVSPSPVGSLHDRACQVFYELKGGLVQFGEQHSREHGHAPTGALYEGLHQGWELSSPIHLMGHSFGGQTCRMLQHLLSTGHFNCAAYATDAGWVRSLTTINAPLNGSLVVHTMGQACAATAALAWGSKGFWLGVALHVLEALDARLLRARAFDPQLQHWRLTWRATLCALRGRSAVFDGADHAAFDMTPARSAVLNRVFRTHGGTYYFSLAGASDSGGGGGAAADASTCGAPSGSGGGSGDGSGGGSGDSSGGSGDKCGGGSECGSSDSGGSDGGGSGSGAKPARLLQAVGGVLYAAMARLHSEARARRHACAVTPLCAVPPARWFADGHDGVLETWSQRVPWCAARGYEPSLPGALAAAPAALTGAAPPPQRNSSSGSAVATSGNGVPPLEPGVWHCEDTTIDHLWAHVSPQRADEVLSRLAAALAALPPRDAAAAAAATREAAAATRAVHAALAAEEAVPAAASSAQAVPEAAAAAPLDAVAAIAPHKCCSGGGSDGGGGGDASSALATAMAARRVKLAFVRGCVEPAAAAPQRRALLQWLAVLSALLLPEALTPRVCRVRHAAALLLALAAGAALLAGCAPRLMR